ncbi:MAG TPA: SDR family oxidoreductase [Aggregatilineaceae bacterium]|nr:SDR family oxidoreductase [Aggregatilineaceae bacterium]
MNKLLVTGASGTLGGPLTERATADGWEVWSAYYSRPDRIRAGHPIQLDLRDAEALRRVVAEIEPSAIIHCAITERSQGDYDTAIRLAGQHVAEVAAEMGIRLVALSTDLVFDGTRDVYTEDTPPQPSANSRYGEAKADAERSIRATAPKAAIVRTSLIYDFDPLNAQVAWMIAAIQCGETMRLFTDQIRCPIWAVNLAEALLELVETDYGGCLNLVGPEPLSRYDLGTALLAALGYDPAKHVVAAAAPDSAPRKLVLSIERAREVLGTPLLTIREACEIWEKH